MAERLLPAFDTPTGIPYGSINLVSGVDPNETPITCTASGGTFALEFGLISRLTGDPRFEVAAKHAVRGLWSRRSSLNLLGGHINVSSGEWTHTDSSIGPSRDSFYEYMLKAALLFDDAEYLEIFERALEAIDGYMRVSDWYVEVHYELGHMTWPYFHNLDAFWPGLLTLTGDHSEAYKTLDKFCSVWLHFGALPEAVNLRDNTIPNRLHGYPLRPELVESLYYFSSTGHLPHSTFANFASLMANTLENRTRVECGYAVVEKLPEFLLRDHMDSFFLAETLKYLYLIFDRSNWVHQRPVVFGTEAHFFHFKPEYFGYNPGIPGYKVRPIPSTVVCPLAPFFPGPANRCLPDPSQDRPRDTPDTLAALPSGSEEEQRVKLDRCLALVGRREQQAVELADCRAAASRTEETLQRLRLSSSQLQATLQAAQLAARQGVRPQLDSYQASVAALLDGLQSQGCPDTESLRASFLQLGDLVDTLLEENNRHSRHWSKQATEELAALQRERDGLAARLYSLSEERDQLLLRLQGWEGSGHGEEPGHDPDEL